MLSVSYWFSLPPVAPSAPPSSSRGSPKSCMEPMVEMTMVNRIVGRSEGMVTLRNCCQRDAPSNEAAS
ncbi:hypothetical protein SCALM49S_03965 [Streptomyces californicus]